MSETVFGREKQEATGTVGSLAKYLFNDNYLGKTKDGIPVISNDELVLRWRNVQSKYGFPLYDDVKALRKKMIEMGIAFKVANTDGGKMLIEGMEVSGQCAYYEGDRTIYGRSNEITARNLRHEAGHAVQNLVFPDMSIEQRELESFLLEVKRSETLLDYDVQAVMLTQVARASLTYHGLKGTRAEW